MDSRVILRIDWSRHRHGYRTLSVFTKALNAFIFRPTSRAKRDSVRNRQLFKKSIEERPEKTMWIDRTPIAANFASASAGEKEVSQTGKHKLEGKAHGNKERACIVGSVHSRRFMDAYERGLNGRQAAWAARKYKGHGHLISLISESWR